MLNYLSQVATLAPAALTVRAQTVSPNDDGRLLYDVFFPRKDVESVKLEDVYAIDFRPAADRRTWNGRGRHIPLKTPSRRQVSIEPIESYARIHEREIQELGEVAMNNRDVILNVIGARLPDRIKAAAASNFRRLELDAFESWILGTITQRNPQNASQVQTASWAFAADRLTTAGTAWNDGSVNAWTLFLAWLEDAQDAVGDLSGAMMRRATYNAIYADAPHPSSGPKFTRIQLEQLIQDNLSSPFQFFVNEKTVDVFTDGGDTTTSTKIFPAQRVAAIPGDQRIGDACFAPIIRSDDLEGVPGQAGQGEIAASDIDPRLNRVYFERENNGRSITAEVQLNALAVPNEQRVFVIDAGV